MNGRGNNLVLGQTRRAVNRFRTARARDTSFPEILHTWRIPSERKEKETAGRIVCSFHCALSPTDLKFAKSLIRIVSVPRSDFVATLKFQRTGARFACSILTRHFRRDGTFVEPQTAADVAHRRELTADKWPRRVSVRRVIIRNSPPITKVAPALLVDIGLLAP